MRARLVVGSSSLASELIDRLRQRAEPLVVCTDDRQFLDRIDDDSVTLTAGDPASVETLESIDIDVQSVLALDDDPAVTVAALSGAETVFPDAFRLGYAGMDPTASDRMAIQIHADKVIEPETIVASTVTNHLGGAGDRLWHLHRALRAVDRRLAILTHDNPDPDAIASALALERIAANVGVSADICYYGSITHQENRAFVNLLNLDLRNLDEESDLSMYDGFALVDHSRPGVNDQLPEDTPIDVVIDHHPPRGPVDGEYVDLRSHVGATSTLLVEYLQQSTIDIDETVATALLFGIRVDTDEFKREVCPTDFEVAATLLETANLGTLQRVESPSMAPETLETIARAISNREHHGPVVLSGVGQLGNRDALAQAADRLLDIEDVTTTLVYGLDERTIYVSARARGANLDLGEALREAFGQIGSAGGHADMAGAQIQIGVMEDDSKPLEEVAAELIRTRFLDVLEERWNRTIRPTSSGQYLVESELEVAEVVVLPHENEPESE